MTASQLAEWEAFDQIEPVGEWRADFRAGQLCSLLVNITNQLYAKKGTTPKQLRPIDFMPWFSPEAREKPKQTVEEMKQILTSIAKSQNERQRRISLRDHPPKKLTMRQTERKRRMRRDE